MTQTYSDLAPAIFRSWRLRPEEAWPGPGLANADEIADASVEVKPGVQHLPVVQSSATSSANIASESPLLLELISDGTGRQHLLLLRLAPIELRVNGDSVPCVVVLNDGDLLRVSGQALRVSAAANRITASAHDLDLAGRECPVCLVPFEPDDQLLQCECGAGYHTGHGGAADLRCHDSLTHCLRCERELAPLNTIAAPR